MTKFAPKINTNKNITDKLQYVSHSHKIIHALVLILFICGITPSKVSATTHNSYALNGREFISLNLDSVILDSDSNAVDTTGLDSITNIIESPERMESTFKSKVKYHADDSMMIDNQKNKAYLWGKAWVEYEEIKLDADYLEVDFIKNEVIAKGLPDSAGTLQNMPIFNEKGQEYKSREMVYNFQTRKGLIKKITTQEASGYIHGETIKMESQDVFYIKNGKYTTCNLDHPHYYVQAHKLKVINNDKIVTGPAYLAIQDVPTFLAVPFGFFPNQDERKSGILIPAIGSSQTKGFNLTDGGYYFGISDQFDLKLIGDIYTNGSWSGRGLARYNSRYKRNGQLSFNYTVNNEGERDTDQFTQRKSMFLNWNHNQAPNRDFRAQVNIGSSDYFQNDLNTSSNNYIRNEFSSNITYTQRFNRTPFSASINASHNQNNVDSTISFTLPELSVNMSRIYPLKRKVKIGRDRWYEKIGVNYTGNFRNKYKTKTNQVFKTNSEDTANIPEYYKPQLNNGVNHKINASTSLKMGYFNVSPGINYTETWYFKTVSQKWDTLALDENGNRGAILKDTTNGLYRFNNLNLNTSISTKMYGIYSFKGPYFKAIRHTLTPTVGVSYIPNLSNRHPEYFGVTQSDTAGNVKNYSIFDTDRGIFGAPRDIEQGNVTFGLQNIIEAKRKKRNDTTDSFTNINLIDAWNFNTSYNMLADSFNWALVNMNIRANLGKYVNINANTVSDLYGIKTNSETGVVSRSQEFRYNQNGQALRLVQLRTSIGLNFSGNSTGTPQEQQDIQQINDYQNPNAVYQDQQYLDFNIPWNLKVNYVFTYNKPLEEVKLVNSLSFSGSMNITPGWKLRMSSSYDFDQEKLGYTTLDIHRDLHCWQIDLNVIPFGDRKSFRINIRVKQGFLQDLKLSKNSRWFDG